MRVFLWCDLSEAAATTTQIEKLLSLGQDAVVALYQDLVRRVAAKETLTVAEVNQMAALRRQLQQRLQPDVPTLPNVLAVFRYLDDEGWKVKQRTVYKHKDEGKLPSPRPDGTYSIPDIDAYAQSFLRRKDGSNAELDDLQRKRLQAETAISEARALSLQLRAQKQAGDLVPKDWSERELAGRLLILKNDFENVARGDALPMVHLVQGNPDRVPDLIAFLLDRIWSTLDRYAAPRDIKVPRILSEEDDEE